ncbi:MAG TPA: hypothetical protein VN203_16255, partial [Candidatus Acidoferrum sp.]|nr:hypothetical protein [Candidatus Acidoferrum sp.]
SPICAFAPGASSQAALDNALMYLVIPAHAATARPFLILGPLKFVLVASVFKPPIFLPALFLPLAFFALAPFTIFRVFLFRHWSLPLADEE